MCVEGGGGGEPMLDSGQVQDHLRTIQPPSPVGLALVIANSRAILSRLT